MYQVEKYLKIIYKNKSDEKIQLSGISRYLPNNYYSDIEDEYNSDNYDDYFPEKRYVLTLRQENICKKIVHKYSKNILIYENDKWINDFFQNKYLEELETSYCDFKNVISIYKISKVKFLHADNPNYNF